MRTRKKQVYNDRDRHHHENNNNNNQSRTALIKAKTLCSGICHKKTNSITINNEFQSKKLDDVKATFEADFGDSSLCETSSETSGTRTDESSAADSFYDQRGALGAKGGATTASAEKNRNNNEEQEEREYIFRCTPSLISAGDLKTLQTMISKLTEEEKDIAAKSDYRYYRLARAAKLSGLPPSDELLRAQEDAAMALAYRYLKNYKKEQIAFDEFYASLQFRKEHSINEARFCFMDEPETAQSQEWQESIKRYIGSKARAVVLNYDEEGRANVYGTGRFATWHTRRDFEGFRNSHGYMFERGIAATQRKTNGKHRMVNVVVDLHGFSKKEHAQPLFMLTDLMKAMKLCYPESIYRVYMVDAPLIARVVLNLVKPLTYAIGTPKEFVTVNGAKQRAKHFGSAIDINYTENIDIDKYYNTPFDTTWVDNFE